MKRLTDHKTAEALRHNAEVAFGKAVKRNVVKRYDKRRDK